MKWRNQLLALCCLVVFAAFGVLYFRYWVVQKPFGIILFIGEGLSPSRLAAARIYGGGVDAPLTLDALPYTALLRNYSNDSATPDSAAAATALATGRKVNNGSIAMDADGNSLATLLELAREAGRTTGLITDSRLTNAAPAAFYAHTPAPPDRQEVARALLESGNVDLVLGGGAAEFLPEAEGGSRGDGRDLLAEAKDAGYDVVRTRAELEAVAWWRWPKVFGVFGPADLDRANEIGPDVPQPALSDMVRRAIELLQYHAGGYLLVVDAGLMRKAAEQNDAAGTLAETVELDRAVSVALRYAGAKTTVLVCGDVAVGGLTVNGFPSRTAGPATISEGDPLRAFAVAWASGPGVARATESVTAAPPAEQSPTPMAPASPEVADRAEVVPPPQDVAAPPTATPAPTPPPMQPHVAIDAPSAMNIAEDMVAFGTGRGAEALHGTLESTAIFEIVRDNL